MVAERAFGFFGTGIAVTSDEPAVLDWLDEFLTPAFEPVARDACNFGVAVFSEGACYDAVAASRPSGTLAEVPCFALDREVKHRPCWTCGGRLVVADEKFGAFYVLADARVEILTSPGSLRFRTGTMRVIREIAVACALADSRRLLLHAAGIEVAGRAVLIAGPKESGKTTLLAYLAASTGAGLLTNDRALVEFSGAGVEVRGVPTIVNVRPGTRDLLPGLFREIAPLPVPADLTLAEAARVIARDGGAAARDRLKLSPAQLAQALGVPRAPRGTLATVAFPEPHADPAGLAVDRLSRAEAERRLLGARFGLRAGKAAPTVFARLTGASRAEGADEALIERLALEMPCFSVRIGSAAYARATTAERILAALLPAPAV